MQHVINQNYQHDNTDMISPTVAIQVGSGGIITNNMFIRNLISKGLINNGQCNGSRMSKNGNYTIFLHPTLYSLPYLTHLLSSLPIFDKLSSCFSENFFPQTYWAPPIQETKWLLWSQYFKNIKCSVGKKQWGEAM